MDDYKLIYFVFNLKSGAVVKMPYNVFTALCIDIILLSLAFWVVCKGTSLIKNGATKESALSSKYNKMVFFGFLTVLVVSLPAIIHAIAPHGLI